MMPFFGPNCGCGTAKQIIWREDLPGLPPGPPGPDPEKPYLTPFRVVEGVYSVLYAHGIMTPLGWSELASGDLTPGMLIKRVIVFNPAMQIAKPGFPALTVGNQAVELYEVNTSVAASAAGDPSTDGRFNRLSLRAGSVLQTIHAPWGFPPYQGQEVGAEGTIYDTPADGVAGNGLIWQRNAAGDLVLQSYFTDRNSIRQGGTAGKFRKWTESTVWSVSRRTVFESTNEPGGTLSRTFSGLSGVRVCEGIVYPSVPVPAQIGAYPAFDLSHTTPATNQVGGTILLDFSATATEQMFTWAYAETIFNGSQVIHYTHRVTMEAGA